MRHDNFIPQPKFIKIHSRGRIPHWRVDDAVYFITFRLGDSLPREAAKALFLERQRMMRGCQTTFERARLDAAFGIRLDNELDRSHGSCLLREHAGVVAGALQHFDRKRYDLHAWVVMPNHVHVLVHVELGDAIPEILHSWKSYTAHEIGHGEIWQKEYFDRVIRSPREFADTQAYIRANPSKAGLRHWAWIG